MAFDGYYSAEREEELLNDIAKFLVNNDFDTITQVLLESVRPIAGVGGPMLYVVGFPVFAFFGTTSLDFGNMLLHNPREKIGRLTKKINDLRDIKEQNQILEEKPKRFSWLRKFFGFNKTESDSVP